MAELKKQKQLFNEDYLSGLLTKMMLEITEINAYYINHDGNLPYYGIDDCDANCTRAIRLIRMVRDELNDIRKEMENRYG